MEEVLKIWEKADKLAGKVDIDKIVEDENGLVCFLTDLENNKKIQIKYDSLVCAYKNVDEGFWIKTLEGLLGRYGEKVLTKHSFFEVENSSFLREIEDGVCGAIQGRELFQLKIIGANAILDIISFGEPCIETI